MSDLALSVPEGHQLDRRRANDNLVAFLQLAAANAGAVDERAIPRRQVFNHHLPLVRGNLRVLARNLFIEHQQVHVADAPDHDGQILRQWEFPTLILARNETEDVLQHSFL